MNRHPVTAGVVFTTIALALAGSARHVQTQSTPSYGVTHLGTLGGTSSVAMSIDDGPFPWIYGYSATVSGEEHAFAGNAWSLRDLGTLGGARSEARAGFFGTVVGTSQVPGGAYHAFLQAGSAPMRDLGTLGGNESYATGVNSTTVVGGSLLSGNAVRRAFAYDLAASVMSELPASLGGTNTVATGINAAGHIVGYADLPGGGHHAFLYADGTTLDLGSFGGNSEALAISAHGVIVGRAAVGGGQHAFRYEAGVMQDLGTLGGGSSAAMDVNPLGHIVGWSETAAGERHAFIWRDGVMTDLNTLIPSGTGWVLEGATGINDRGAIVGDGQFQGERRAFLLTPPLDIRVDLRVHNNFLDTNIPNPHEAGQRLTFGVTVRSNGPFTATGIIVTDTLSGPVEIIGWSGAESCVREGLQLTCRLRAVDFARDFFIDVRSTAAGVITHSATIAADQPDPNPSNNSASESNTAVSLATLTLTPTTVVGGDVSLGRATLTSVTPLGGARVILTSSHPEIASVPSPFDVLPWCCDGIWREFNVFTQPVSTPVTVQISATYGLVTRVVPLTITRAPSSPRGPYGGTARPVPGLIEAEDFDEGGQGVAYHDTSSGNAGGQYRATDVDIEATSDSGGGYNVGWIHAGEWLEYTVNVATTGAYTLEARVASPGAGGTFHIAFDGVDRTGSLSVPDTGGWQAWTTISRPVMLEAGTRVMRVAFDTNGVTGAFGNLNWLRISSASTGSLPFGGTPSRIPGRIEAEHFDEGGEGVAYHDASSGNSGGQYRWTDVDIEVTTDIDGGYNVGWMTAGEWLAYSVDVEAGGQFTLLARVAANGPGGTFHLEANGVDLTGPIVIPDTGGWQNWESVIVPAVPLSAGRQVLRVVMDANGPTGVFGNINYLQFSR